MNLLNRSFLLVFVSGTSLLLAGCGGGASSTSSVSAASTGTSIGVTASLKAGSVAPFAIRTSQNSSRNPLTLGDAPITVSYQGATVASGRLDANGFADLTFTQSVPAGATVTVTIGTGAMAIVATVTLATAVSATAVDIVYSSGPPPSITVTKSADPNGDGQVEGSDAQQVTETENPASGSVEDVNSLNGDQLPSNLPITVTACGTSTITVAPSASAPTGLSLTFEEKVQDSDTSPQYEYETNAFTSPLTFPYLSSAARIDLEITQNGQKLITVEAPIGSITGSTGAAGATLCPTVSPTTTPAPSPST